MWAPALLIIVSSRTKAVSRGRDGGQLSSCTQRYPTSLSYAMQAQENGSSREGGVDLDALEARLKKVQASQAGLLVRDYEREMQTHVLVDDADQIQNLLQQDSKLADKYTWTWLYGEGLRGKPRILRMALENGVPVDTRSPDGCPPLLAACHSEGPGCAEVYRILLEYQVNIHEGDENWTPFQKAICHDDVNLVTALVAAGVDPNAESEGERGPPLFFALYMNAIRVFGCLLELGASPTCTFRGQGLLHYLPRHKEVREPEHLARLIVENGCDVNMLDNRGYSAFLVAVGYGRLDLMETFLKLGADLHDEDQQGGNALWVLVNSAIGIYNPDCATFLLRKGLSVDHKAGHGETPRSRLAKYIETLENPAAYQAIQNVISSYEHSLDV